MSVTGPASVGAPAPVPAPGQAPLPAPSVAALFERNAEEFRDSLAVSSDHVQWTHAEYVEQCRRWAGFLASLEPSDLPRALHVGVLLPNTPDYLAALGGAALAGSTIVGLNSTRRGREMLRDIEHTDVDAIITDHAHADLLAPIAGELTLPGGLWIAGSSDGFDIEARNLGARDLDVAIANQQPANIFEEPGLDTTWCLIFTSGTTAAPKAVICSQRRMLQTGERMRQLLDIDASDVGYVSMPLFHSNALMVGFMPAMVAGASVALAPKFTASGWLNDVRRYGATWFNYTGNPLAYILSTPERPDDADNPLRRACGNEGSPDVLRRFSERFDVEVLDLFGPTEGAIGIVPEDGMPAGAIGRTTAFVKVVDHDGDGRAVARLDQNGRLLNADQAVGEIVNTAGPGPFEGYYGNHEATAKATRFGWYWTGDLGYVDEEGWLYFAGRDNDWLRVDGENFPAGPVERILNRHPDFTQVCVYAVPDANAGDQVMAAVVLEQTAAFDPKGLAEWLDEQADLSPKWRPRYVRLASSLPATATGKPLTRELRIDKVDLDRCGGDTVWVRARGEAGYRRFTRDDEADLRHALEASGRLRFWDL